MAFVTYGLPSTRPSPILCKRYFGELEPLKRDCLEAPELVGLGQVNNEDSERHGTAMLDAFACALEVRSIYTIAFQISHHPLFVADVRFTRCNPGFKLNPRPTPDPSRRRVSIG